MRYVAFLRAINVGGHIVKMDRLRALFTEMKLDNVDTFIASGNVLFDSRAQPAALEERIETHLHVSLGYPVATFIRPIAAVPEIIRAHPFASGVAEGQSLYVALLKHGPSATQRQAVAALQTPDDQLHVEHRELYWLCRTSVAESRVTGARIERSVGPATMRNITSLQKLAKKAGFSA